MSHHSDGFPNYFLFLCFANRRQPYMGTLRGLPYEFLFVETSEKLLLHILEHPPAAILLDILTVLKIGAEDLHPLDELGLKSPVIRCNIKADGSLLALCVNPPQNAPLTEAIEKIAAGDKQWVPENRHRRFLRFDIQRRIRIKIADSQEWVRCTSLNISNGGIFVINYDPPPPGTQVLVEICNLGKEEPVTLHTEVAWRRRWEDSDLIPGAGLRFIQPAPAERITELMHSSLQFKKIFHTQPSELHTEDQ